MPIYLLTPTLRLLGKFRFYLLLGLTIIGIALTATAQTDPAINPRALEILKSASDYLKASPAYSFQADITFDDVAPPDLKLQYNSTARVLVGRPDRLRIDYTGDRRNVSFYFDGKDFTLFDKENMVYSTFSAPPTIDATLNLTLDKYGFLVPLADLVSGDLYQATTGKLQRGFYFGLVSLNGRKVHHLVFIQNNVDWQVWIQADKRPLIDKLVITYKNLTTAPQYSAQFPVWDFKPKLQASAFTFEAPKNVTRIEFLPNNNSQVGGHK